MTDHEFRAAELAAALDGLALGCVAAVVLIGVPAAFVAARTYLNDPRRPKPPLGWPPWVKPGLRRRAGYAVRYGWYKARAGLCSALVAIGAKKSW